MRLASMLIGIALLVAGIWVLADHPTYSSTDTALKVGTFTVQSIQHKAIPAWTGIAGVVVGGLLLLGGLVGSRKR